MSAISLFLTPCQLLLLSFGGMHTLRAPGPHEALVVSIMGLCNLARGDEQMPSISQAAPAQFSQRKVGTLPTGP